VLFDYNGYSCLFYVFMMKKVLFIVYWLVLAFVSTRVEAFDWTQCEEKEFILTAYYSPINWQSFYYKPDFKSEKRLNGEWIHGASWEPVFDGMLAAPSNYSFGDRIYFPDMWLGKVSDRWWAIVKAWERRFNHDRIDVWVWYGEEWLIRALDFWVQKKKWYYCKKSDLSVDDRLSISREKIGLNLKSIPLFEHFFDLAIWKQELRFGRRDIWVWTLQKYLVKLGYLKENKQTGRFDVVTKDALCRYQTKKLISYPAHRDCGVYGPRTRSAMKKDVEKKSLLPVNLREHGTVNSIKKQADAWDLAKGIITSQKNNNIYFDKPFFRNTYNQKVEKLQYLLKYLWHYNGDVDGVFDEETIGSVYKFQLAENILKWISSDVKVAGYVWPSTRSKLNLKLKEKHESEKLVKLNEIFETSKSEKKLYFSFYRPYKRGEWPNAEIRILQNFLKDLSLYSGDAYGVYDSQTIDSVYNFQIKYWLLDEYSHRNLHGYLWPSTRQKLNEMIEYSF